MIRIMTATESQAITFTVDGRSIGESVEALDTRMKEAIGHALLGRLAAITRHDCRGIYANCRT